MKKMILLSILITLFIFSCSGSSNQNNDVNSLTVIRDFTTGWTRNFNIFSTGIPESYKGFIYEPVMIFDSLNNNQEHLWLAEEVTLEPDYKTVIVKIRDGIKWSDGVAFTAEDLAYSFTFSRENPQLDRTGDWGENGRIESVEILDPLTVKIVMKKPNKFTKSALFSMKFMIPKHIYENLGGGYSFCHNRNSHWYWSVYRSVYIYSRNVSSR